MPEPNSWSRADAGRDAGVGRQEPPAPFESAGDAHATLANDHRRWVLDELADVDGPLSIGGLTCRLAAREDGDSTDARQRIYIALSRTHVPSLQRHGLVDHDQNVGTVSLAVPDQRVRALLAWQLENQPRSGLNTTATGSE